MTRAHPDSLVPLEIFLNAYESFRPAPNAQALSAIEASADEGVFIVAGPGTGKTTCLTLRVLKLVLVDGLPPGGIIATTFTVKAAAELRSRILGWGFRLIEALSEDADLGDAVRARLGDVDINQVATGTLDSLCERVLRDWRAPGTRPPLVADEFVSRTLMLRNGLLDSGRWQSASLESLIVALRGSRFNLNVSTKTDTLRSIADRRHHDVVDWPAFLSPPTTPKTRLDEALTAYDDELGARGLYDFSRLEASMRDSLVGGSLDGFLDTVDAVVVDEYQDTNLLQEQIYLAIARGCDGRLTVVGDDDQSLYRFRGATVELFRDFAQRYEDSFGRAPQTVFLQTNYRSSPSIVDFVKGYVRMDADFQSVRVASKPDLQSGLAPEEELPVLAMYRPDLDTLARDLAGFIHQIFRGTGFVLPDGKRIQAASSGGDVGDCALLCSSPRETKPNGDPRLPGLLRSELEHRSPPIHVFNPRGEALESIPAIARLAGLLLLAIDPNSAVQGKTSGVGPATATFDRWRADAVAFLRSAEPGLVSYVSAWAARTPEDPANNWPHSVAVLDLLYALVHYFPDLYDTPEGQVALEVFTRQLSATDQVGAFRGRVLTDPNATPDQHGVTLPERSVIELLRNFLAPIASGVIGVNEELVESFPRDRVSVLSVHQAKGLEFPLVVVDVGSEFRTPHYSQAFKRFPRDEGEPHRMEDLFRPFSPLAAPARSGVDRAFDDLLRQYFVAFSRPQDALLLVGLDSAKPDGSIPNVALGWDRASTAHWATNAPYVEI